MAAAIGLLGAAMLLAATPAAQPPETSTAQMVQAPLIRTTTRLVQLNAVVLDNRNHSVTGLRREDFRVYDNGVEQQIAHFTAGAGAPPAQPVELSPLAISNRQASAGESPGATVILVDETLLDPQLLTIVSLDLTAPIRQARLLVMQYPSTVKPGQQVALYALRRQGVVVIRDFTDDPSKLVAAAKALGNSGSGKYVTLDDVVATKQTRTLHQWAQNPSLTDRMEGYGGAESLRGGTLGYGLQAVIRHLKGVPGRKNLIWISTSFPMAATAFGIAAMADGVNGNVPLPPGPNSTILPSPHSPDPQGHFNEVQEFARSLGNANIAVYPIDAFGLTYGGSSESQRATADMIATESGGRAIFDSNGMVQSLQQIVSASSDAYQMGYYPGDKAWDGNYHHIELKLAPQHKGMKVLCRRGYYAMDERVEPTSDRAFLEATRSVVEAPDIGVTLNVPSNPLEAGSEQVLLKLSIQDIQFDQKDNHPDAKLDVAFVQIDRDGLVVQSFKDNIDLGLKRETFLKAERQGWLYPRTLWVQPNAETLRVVVRDLKTGALGSVSVPVHSYSNQKIN
jgi:VWFA-related protein